MAASARIDELRSKFDDNPRRYFASLANEYRKAGDLGTAIAICRTQLRHFPTHMSGHVVLGQALFEAGELDAARMAFERAVELDPENLIALRHLGDVAVATSDANAARKWYRRVLDIDGGNEAIAAQLAALEAQVEPAREPDPDGPRPADARLYTADPLEIEPGFAETADDPLRATSHEPLDDVIDWAPAALPDVVDGAAVSTDSAAEAMPAAGGPASVLTDAEPLQATPVESFEFVDDWAEFSLGEPASESDDPVEVVGLDLAPEVDDAALEQLQHADAALDQTSAQAPVDGSPEAPIIGPRDEVALDTVGSVELSEPEPEQAQEPAAEAEGALESEPESQPESEPTVQDAGERLTAPAAGEPSPLSEPEPESAPEREADAEGSAVEPTAGLEVIASPAFVTETMAELCVLQGHDEQALAIYDQLVAQRAGDAGLLERRDAVQARIAARGESSASAGAFLRRLAERRPEPMLSRESDDDVVAHAADPEYEPEPDLLVEHSAENDAVVEEQPATAAPSAEIERSSWAASTWAGAFLTQPAAASAPDLSFDRFFVGLEELPAPFGTEAAASAPEPDATSAAVAAPERPAEVPSAPAPNEESDLAEFNAWLRGLRET
jgi:tetratricopeptide (TPR) repeat protein